MKKFVLGIMLSAMFLVTPVFADTQYSEVATPAITVDGNDFNFKGTIITDGNEDYFQMRPLLNDFGITDDEIVWDGDTQTVTVNIPAPADGSTGKVTTIQFQIGKSAYSVNGNIHPMDATPFIYNDSTYLPVKYVSEALGYTVDFNKDTNVATIVSGPDAVLPLSSKPAGSTSAATQNEFAKYKTAADSINNAKSVEMNATMTITTTYKGQTETVPMSMNIKEVKKSDNDTDLAMTMTMDSSGTKISANMYYTNGYLYVDSAGKKVKEAMDLTTLSDSLSSSNFASFDKSAVTDASVKDVNGGQQVTLTLDPAKMTELTNQVLDQMSSALNTDVSSMSITVDNMSLTAVVGDDGNLKSYNMVYSLDLGYQGDTIHADYTTNIDIVGINTIDSIDFPDDLNTYKEAPTTPPSADTKSTATPVPTAKN